MIESGTVFASGITENAFTFNLNNLNTDDIYIIAELVQDPNPYQAPATWNCTIHPGDISPNASTSGILILEGVPKNYHHGIVSAQFDISSPSTFTDETLDFDLTITATWSFNDSTSVPVGMVEEKTESLKLDNHLDGSRITKNWQVRAIYEDGTQSSSHFGFLPNGKMTFNITNNALDTITINNIYITASFYFAVNEYINAEGV